MSGKLKHILITGTSRGIGKELGAQLQENFKIIKVSRTGKNCENIDLSQSGAEEKLEQLLQQKDIQLSGIIVNAGVGYFGSFESGNTQEYEDILRTNLLSPIITLQKLYPYLEEKSKIIFIGSIIAKKFMKHAAVYQASKFGLRGLAGGLKNEWKEKGVHIINPKIVDTSFHDHSNIKIEKNLPKTEMRDIIETVQNIFDGKEKRFEIDL